MSLIRSVISSLPATSSMSQVAKAFTDAIHDFYIRHNWLDKAELQGCLRVTCSAVVYSKVRQEVWMFGDCQFRYNGKTFTNEKTVDGILSSVRSDILHYALRHGQKLEQLLIEDVGRRFIFDFLKDQCSFQNSPSAGPFTYTVIDGFPMDLASIPIFQVYPEQCNSLILASDGYPEVYDTLSLTEEALHKILQSDPLLINGNHKATKAWMNNSLSFDDRTYLSLLIS